MELFKAALIGIVQGITEWLPVSSTGHMILFNEFIKMNVSETFMSTFLVVIQFGSILAVLTIFFKKLNPFDVSKNKIKKTNGRIIWSKEIPAAFIANNSNRSPKLPKVINDANKIANGKAIGTIVTAA